MKMWAFSKPRRTCYCHFPVFLATGGVRPKYQFFTAAEFKKSQEVIRGGERGNRVRPSILPHVTGNHIQYCQNTEKGEEKKHEKQKGPGFICIQPNLRLAGRQKLLEEFH